MSKRILSQEQIEGLLLNQNIAGCSAKSITYRKEFKVLAVRQYQEGLPPTEIFKQARFDISVIGSKTPKRCLRRWVKVFRVKGEAGLTVDGRSQNNPRGRPTTKHLTGREKLKYYEAQIAYLKAENAFLAKLRKQRLN